MLAFLSNPSVYSILSIVCAYLSTITLEPANFAIDLPLLYVILQTLCAYPSTLFSNSAYRCYATLLTFCGYSEPGNLYSRCFRRSAHTFQQSLGDSSQILVGG